MKKIVLLALVITISVVFTIAAIQVAIGRNPTPNVGWNSWVPQYHAATNLGETLCWSLIPPQPNVGWNS